MSEEAVLKIEQDFYNYLGCRSKIPVSFMKLKPDAQAPKRGTSGSVGFDLYSVQSAELYPLSPFTIDTGIAIELPDGYEAQVRPRSGLARKGVVAQSGTIDSDYRGSIGITLIWFASDEYQAPFVIHVGDRIAQLVIAPVARVWMREVSELSVTERGSRGFGSTGVK
jgi:dUTP pyrophosphatase